MLKFSADAGIAIRALNEPTKAIVEILANLLKGAPLDDKFASVGVNAKERRFRFDVRHEGQKAHAQRPQTLRYCLSEMFR